MLIEFINLMKNKKRSRGLPNTAYIPNWMETADISDFIEFLIRLLVSFFFLLAYSMTIYVS